MYTCMLAATVKRHLAETELLFYVLQTNLGTRLAFATGMSVPQVLKGV